MWMGFVFGFHYTDTGDSRSNQNSLKGNRQYIAHTILVFDNFDIILKIFFSGVVDLTSAKTNVSQDSGYPGCVTR